MKVVLRPCGRGVSSSDVEVDAVKCRRCREPAIIEIRRRARASAAHLDVRVES